MGMVVRTNMAAINANNALQNASKAQQNGMQKLASGFKINKAADDASGLSISEKMKAQIKALDTAKDNCEDGANLIQTTEGYMAETHDMLNRMVELSEKAANGVLENTDRDALQDEMDELCAEIDRMATTANFNGRKLLDGSIGSTGTVKITSDADGNHYSVADNVETTATKYTPATATAVTGGGSASTVSAIANDLGVTNAADIASITEKITNAVNAAAADDTTAANAMKVLADNVETAKDDLKTAQDTLLATPNAANATAVSTKATALQTAETNLKDGKTGGTTQIKSTVTVYANKAGDVYATLDDTDEKATELAKNEYSATTNVDGYAKYTVDVNLTTASGTVTENEGIKLQIGESSTKADKMEVKVGSFHTDTLLGGIDGFVNKTASKTGETDNAAAAAIKKNETATYDGGISIDISDQDKASAAADALRQVSNYVSDQRGKLGAQQNRLDHTVNNLSTASENVSAANSRIRDTDMAKEMMAYTSKNVIAQAAQSMLAQANSQPQNVLSLLQ